MCLYLLRDVVAFRLEWQRRKWPADRVHRGERIDILERRHDLCVAGHRDNAVMGFTHNRPFAAQGLPIGVRILCDVGVGEVVDLRQVSHRFSSNRQGLGCFKTDHSIRMLGCCMPITHRRRPSSNLTAGSLSGRDT